MKETLKTHKELIKLETIKIRSLKERNRILSRNHSLTWKDDAELRDTQRMNSSRHYWYFRLKNLYSKKHGKFIMDDLNEKYYGGKTAVFLNEKGAEEFFKAQLSKLEC